jgi:hypothetical protein
MNGMKATNATLHTFPMPSHSLCKVQAARRYNTEGVAHT